MAVARRQQDDHPSQISSVPLSTSGADLDQCQQRSLDDLIPSPRIEVSPYTWAAYTGIPPNKPSSSGLMTEIPPAVFNALFKNGAMMGISCGTVVPAKSSPQPPTVPGPLQPTALQLTTIHPKWIDRFPFPRMRNNLIEFSGIIDEEGFLEDLFSMESFSIKSGCASWDPTGWVVGREFSRKWEYLFY